MKSTSFIIYSVIRAATSLLSPETPKTKPAAYYVKKTESFIFC